MSEEERKILEEEKDLLQRLNENVENLTKSIGGLEGYIAKFMHPGRFFFLNFLAGIFRGLGIAIGMTMVAALVVYILIKVLTAFIDFPIIGMYITKIIEFVDQYLKQEIPSR